MGSKYARHITINTPEVFADNTTTTTVVDPTNVVATITSIDIEDTVTAEAVTATNISVPAISNSLCIRSNSYFNVFCFSVGIEPHLVRLSTNTNTSPIF